MTDLGFFHPVAIHFAIGLVTAGVLLRWLSLAWRSAFAAPAASALIVLAAAATLLATRSGNDAHVAVEAAPGVAALVHAHQQWGERTQDVVLVVAGLEVLAVVLRGRAIVGMMSAAAGVLAVGCLLETGKLGGELVYGHAAGVGIRSGDPGDVARLFLAGLVRQAEVDEKQGRAADAARLLMLAARRFPRDTDVQLRAAEALLEDRRDAARALAVLERVEPAADDARLRFRRGWLTADALDAIQRRREARVVLERMQVEFPESGRLRSRLARADAGPASTNRP